MQPRGCPCRVEIGGSPEVWWYASPFLYEGSPPDPLVIANRGGSRGSAGRTASAAAGCPCLGAGCASSGAPWPSHRCGACARDPGRDRGRRPPS